MKTKMKTKHLKNQNAQPRRKAKTETKSTISKPKEEKKPMPPEKEQALNIATS